MAPSIPHEDGINAFARREQNLRELIPFCSSFWTRGRQLEYMQQPNLESACNARCQTKKQKFSPEFVLVPIGDNLVRPLQDAPEPTALQAVQI